MKKPDTPCAGCGKLLYTSPWSLPAGQRMCHTCRRAEPQRKSYGEPRKCALPECDVIYTPGARAKGAPQQRYCSRPCAHKGGMGGTPVPLTVCEICGKQFRPGGGRVQRACNRKCGVELRRRERGTAGREPTRWPSHRIYVRDCVWCGKLFVARTTARRACSLACSRKTNWAKSNLARRNGATERLCPCGVVIPLKRWKCTPCLAADRRAQRQRKRRAERARKRSAKREPYTLAEIAARDRYRCGICLAEGRSRQARVTMTKAVPHPKAPTIDHVVPLSISKDDTRANVQLAHFGCNVRKHTGGSQQLALIG